jgi:hypothetical protein
MQLLPGSTPATGVPIQRPRPTPEGLPSHRMVSGDKRSVCGGNRIGLRRRFRRGNGSRWAYASDAITLVIFPRSFQPSICWRVRMKTTLPGMGTRYRATQDAVMSHQPSTGVGSKPRKRQACTQRTPALTGAAASTRVSWAGGLGTRSLIFEQSGRSGRSGQRPMDGCWVKAAPGLYWLVLCHLDSADGARLSENASVGNRPRSLRTSWPA